MTHKSKIMPATSPLFCNRSTCSKTHYILLIWTLHVWFIDVNGRSASATTKV